MGIRLAGVPLTCMEGVFCARSVETCPAAGEKETKPLVRSVVNARWESESGLGEPCPGSYCVCWAPRAREGALCNRHPHSEYTAPHTRTVQRPRKRQQPRDSGGESHSGCTHTSVRSPPGHPARAQPARTMGPCPGDHRSAGGLEAVPGSPFTSPVPGTVGPGFCPLRSPCMQG